MPLLPFLKSRLPKNAFWRNLTVMAGGSAAGQALSILASPLLSRLYAASDFGLLSVYASITSIVSILAALTYHQAIPVPERDEDGANLTILSLILVGVAALLTGALMALFHARLERYLGIPGFSKYAAAIPLGVLGLSAYEVLSQWAARKKAFGLIAKTSAQRSVAQVCIQLGGGLAKLGSAGLVAGQLVGQWGGTFQVARQSWSRDKDKFRNISPNTLAAQARRFSRFPILALPGALLYAVDSNAAPLLFAHFFGATITGYFALGHRLVSVPFMIIGSSAQKVFYPAAAAAKHNGTLAIETDETFRRLLRIVLPIVCIMTACAPEMFSTIMGEKWREAGVYMQWLSLRSCFTMLVFPLTPLIYVLDRQAMGTLFSGLQLIVRVGAVYVGNRYGDARLAVALLGVGTGLLWLGYMVYLLAISGNKVTVAMAQLLREAAIGTAIALPILGVKLLRATDLGVTLIAAVASLVGVIVIARRSSVGPVQRTEPPSAGQI